MTRTFSEEDIAALVAVRSVIADAAHHPGRQAAIKAIDRLGEDPVTVTHAPIDPDEFDAGLQRILDALVDPGGPPEAVAPGCADCEKRKQADDRFMRQMLGPSELALEEPPHDDGCRCTACCREKFSKQSALRPPEELVGALHDRIHPTSGPLLSATPIATQRHVRHQLFDSTCEAVKHWECSDCHETAKTSPDQMRHPCGRCGGWMDRPTSDTPCHVCGARFSWEKSVDMNVPCNGITRTITTCGSDDCRGAVMRTNRPADKPRLLAKRGDAVRHPKHGWYAIVQGVDGDSLWLSISGVPGVQRELASDVEVIARDTHPPDERVEVGSLYAVKWTNPVGKSGLGAERAQRAYLERSHNEVPRQEGWTYEIVPATDGDKEYKFERDYVPAAWLYEASALIMDAVHRAGHGVCGETCWKCKAERFLEGL